MIRGMSREFLSSCPENTSTVPVYIFSGLMGTSDTPDSVVTSKAVYSMVCTVGNSYPEIRAQVLTCCT
uniref:Uncharacterized protein n=1 Tax=Anguilla anguilla TaxID=7936 RepID=A0A0E9R2E8_ANGAN